MAGHQQARGHREITVFLADDNLIVREGVCAVLSMEGDLRIVGTAADYDESVSPAEEDEPPGAGCFRTQATRAHIVAAGNAERRKIERNLHDGAQQHLVALAVKLRMIQQLGQRDAEPALAMVEEPGATCRRRLGLRTLVPGTYSPLPVDKGLPEALQAAAARAPSPQLSPSRVSAVTLTELEAAVYFCCLEALHNAGKHASSGARVMIDLRERDGTLLFEVADDGAGFDLAAVGRGHGLANMADRLGAMGSAVELWSAPGQDTRVSGRAPLPRAPGTSTPAQPAMA